MTWKVQGQFKRPEAENSCFNENEKKISDVSFVNDDYQVLGAWKRSLTPVQTLDRKKLQISLLDKEGTHENQHDI